MASTVPSQSPSGESQHNSQTPTTATATTPSHSDPTFRTNTLTAAQAYQAGRRGYPSTLLNTILSHHTDTGGQFDALLDVGCGPGTATRLFSPRFQHAYGVDPSPSMITTALTIPSSTLSGNAISYAVGPAESLLDIAFPLPPPPSPPSDSSSFSKAQPLAPNSVDLITCAMSAHWFSPISSFYHGASRLLKPGGTLAMWTASSYYCHPHTTPHAAAVQAILSDLETRILAPYEVPGNRLSRDAYDNLPLPWDGNDLESNSSDQNSNQRENPEKKTMVTTSFDASTFVRKEWNRHGHVEPGEKFMTISSSSENGDREGYTLEEFARGLATSSMVQRWRAANRQAVDEGRMEDCVHQTVRRLREVLGDGDGDGVDDDDVKNPLRIEGGPAVVLLMIKKKI